MTFARSPARASRTVNGLLLLCISAVLYGAFVWQILHHQPPCPLCLLQRMALILIGAGLLLNLRLGPSPLHYAMAILGALGGLAVSGWQILAHSLSGGSAYGELLLGLQVSTWVFAWFVCLLVISLAMLALDRKWGDNNLKRPLPVWGFIIMGLFMAATLANTAVISVKCGVGSCAAAPDPQIPRALPAAGFI